MKKLAVMGSGFGSNFEAIANYFSNKDVEITCISDDSEAQILKRAEKLGIKYIHVPFEENFKYFTENKFDLVALAGYMRILPENVLQLSKFVNIHPSILPAFKGKDAIKRAFLAGVKLSGITIHWVEKDLDNGRIIAQYPVFISNDTRFDEFERNIHSIEHKLYPLVLHNLLEDRVFDFQDFLSDSSQNGGGCGGCGSCSGH